MRVIDHLRERREIIEDICATGGRFLLNVYWHSAFNTGEEFEPSLLRSLADLSLGLGVDVYCDNESASASEKNRS